MAATSSSVSASADGEHGARIGLVDDVEADARHRQVVGPAQLPDRRGDVRRPGGERVGLGDVGDADELHLVDLEDPGGRPVAVAHDRLPALPAPQQHRHRSVGDPRRQAHGHQHQSAATLPWMNDSFAITFGPRMKG